MSSLHQRQKKRSEVGCKVAQGFYLKIGAPIQTTHSLLLLPPEGKRIMAVAIWKETFPGFPLLLIQMPTSARPLPLSCRLTPQPA